MEVLLFFAVIGVIPAVIANRKGKDFFPWWIYGTLLFPIALIHAIAAKTYHRGIELHQASEGMRKCPQCAEMVKAEAKICRYCQRDLPAVESPVVAPDPVSDAVQVPRRPTQCPDCGRKAFAWDIDNRVSTCASCGQRFHVVPV